jgi:transcriptional regulator with XRE-family HTH domain
MNPPRSISAQRSGLNTKIIKYFRYITDPLQENDSHYIQMRRNVYDENHMPAKSPSLTAKLEKTLCALGQQLRDRRKLIGTSASITAEASGLSRVTLYRIEKGEASVAMGAYLNVIFALGLKIDLTVPQSSQQKRKAPTRKIPSKIRIADYKQLQRLAWQLKRTKEISPQEALDLYERNWRHVDVKAMDVHEQKFLEELLAAFGRERLLV